MLDPGQAYSLLTEKSGDGGRGGRILLGLEVVLGIRWERRAAPSPGSGVDPVKGSPGQFCRSAPPLKPPGAWPGVRFSRLLIFRALSWGRAWLLARLIPFVGYSWGSQLADLSLRLEAILGVRPTCYQR